MKTLEEILEYFAKNPNEALAIEKVVMADQNVSKLLEKATSSSPKLMTALTRAINSYNPARAELQKVMSTPEVLSAIKKKIEESKPAMDAIREAVNRDDYCKQVMIESIMDSGEDTMNAIEKAIQSSPDVNKLVNEIINK